jgi:ribonuclease HI
MYPQWNLAGNFSWKNAGQSVIDYGIVSASLLPMIQEFRVEEPEANEDDDWSDHMRICITLDAKAFETVEVPPRTTREVPNFSGSEYIDQLYEETMNAKETKDEALDSLWGPTLCESKPIHIYVEGVAARDSKTGPSGAGIVFGLGAASNRALRVPGPERLTADRARLFAIHEAIHFSPSDKTLIIFCTSKMIIRQLCYVAARNSTLGWPGSKGDLFKAVIKMLAARHAATCFVFMDSKREQSVQARSICLGKERP